jgi:hypothetical protein
LACPIRRLTVKGSMPLAINAEACGNGGRRPGSRNKLAEEAFNIALKFVNEGGEQAMREVMLKEPAKFCQLMVALIPQHFKHEVEHTIAGLSPDEVRARLAESRASWLGLTSRRCLWWRRCLRRSRSLASANCPRN